MKRALSKSPVVVFVLAAMLIGPASIVRAQEADVISSLGEEVVESLGKNLGEFGGDALARQTAKRLVAEAAESAGSVGGGIVKAQVERILATGRESLILDLKALSGKSLPLLTDVTDEALPSAVSTLARPGVGEAIESLGTAALKKAALAGETRLPGVGLKLVQHYGDEGANLVAKLTEDQANSLLASLRPNAINALSTADRSSLLNALTNSSEARVFNLNGVTGPLVVVTGGVVVWHGIDVAMGPDERVTERPDGTVIREKTRLASHAVAALPASVQALSVPLKWTGVSLAAGASLIAGLLLWRRQSRKYAMANVRQAQAAPANNSGPGFAEAR